jgi:hypothetical protein
MKPMKPASVLAETSPVAGISFLNAAGRRGCMWPLGGSGADMIVCGDPRSGESHYCAPHHKDAHSPHLPKLR